MRLPTQQIRLAGPFASADLDRLIEELVPLTAIREPTLVTVDLRALERISAPSAAVLTSALLDVDARGLVAAGSEIVAPRRARVRQRLEELDVLGLLLDRPPEDDAAPRRDRGSRPCQRFMADDDPGRVAYSLTDAMAEVCPTDGPACNAMWFALNEITQNVIEHANAPGGGVAIAEVTRGGAAFEVAIADHGVGVRASLARNPSYRDLGSDLIALQTAMKAGVTARPERPGGLGLFFTQLLLRHNGGGMVMRSGAAQLEVGATPSASVDIVAMRGTLVTLRFRTDHPFSLDVILTSLDRG
jgi:anti-sigma regulatory factor (Ser/Thr protein kinase)